MKTFLVGILIISFGSCWLAAQTGPRCNNSKSGKPEKTLLDSYNCYDLLAQQASDAKSGLDTLQKKAVYKLFTDNLQVTFKPQFGNTFPNLLGNPVVSTDQFTLKPDVFGLTYSLPLKNVNPNSNHPIWKYLLNFVEIGVSGGIGPKSNAILGTLVLRDSFQGTGTAYIQVKFSGKDLREAHEKTEQDAVKKAGEARDQALIALVKTLSQRLAQDSTDNPMH